jgi:hypothetical protein
VQRCPGALVGGSERGELRRRCATVAGRKEGRKEGRKVGRKEGRVGGGRRR